MGLNNLSAKHLIVIAGVHKAATTSLHSYLNQHKDICSGISKEIHYYTPIRYGKEPHELDSYLQNFAFCTTEKYIIDASPSYIYGKSDIANRIKNDFENVKILVILRNPTDRFISFYKAQKSAFSIDQDECLNTFIKKSYSLKMKSDIDEVYSRAFREGCYADYLEDWLKIFGNSLKILFFDNIKNNTDGELKDIYKWLSIDNHIYNDKNIYNIRNKTRFSKVKSIHQLSAFFNRKYEWFFRKHPIIKTYLTKLYFKVNEDINIENINKDDIDLLRSYYMPEIIKLRKLLLKFNYTRIPIWLKKV